MNKSMIAGTLLGVGVATAGGAISGYQLLKEPDHAVVLRAVPVTQTTQIPHEECRDVTVTRQRAVQDQHRIAGKAIGAVIGGALGNQVGGGNGKKAATVVGAVAGGYAGDRVQNNMQKSDTYTTTEQRCKTAYESREDVIGYDVTYRLKEREDVVRMAYDPGTEIPLKDGRLVLDQPPASAAAAAPNYQPASQYPATTQQPATAPRT